ncbi:MAG TPA: lytic transglycosylase domain-containing protein [Anaeromyxobacter sp.]
MNTLSAAACMAVATIPATARSVANVRAGVRYLRRLVRAFGEIDVALMAYNAGPNRILRHMRRGPIPDRFHAYPRKLKGELERLRRALAGQALPRGGAPAPLFAAAPVCAPSGACLTAPGTRVNGDRSGNRSVP